MGQEVSHQHFSKTDFTSFAKKLEKETQLLKDKLSAGEFSSHSPVGGFEVEACLLDQAACPTSINQAFFDIFNNPLATPELAKFNIELNNDPLVLNGDVFKAFEQDLNTVFKDADAAADALQSRVLLTGILPTLQPEHCCVANMSEMKRYHALNEQVLKARNGKPINLDIQGVEHLQLQHNSVMLEAATTSFQVHLQTPWQQAHHYYNASIIASAPVMAMSGNSPYLFGKQLWHESRIPLFEQAVDTGATLRRVSFGTGFADKSISECFEENVQNYPVLLPMIFDNNADSFSHLRLHNGVIWRWNRPLVGFDSDDTPHIRIEHRIMPAGPTITDMIANAVFYYGLAQSLMEKLQEQGSFIKFSQAKQNFYQAAQHGLKAKLDWGGKTLTSQQLILDTLLSKAESGLQQLGINHESTQHYLGIIASRVEAGQTGAAWQIEHVKKTACDMQQLTQDYLYHQHIGLPVHTWSH